MPQDGPMVKHLVGNTVEEAELAETMEYAELEVVKSLEKTSQMMKKDDLFFVSPPKEHPPPITPTVLTSGRPRRPAGSIYQRAPGRGSAIMR